MQSASKFTFLSVLEQLSCQINIVLILILFLTSPEKRCPTWQNHVLLSVTYCLINVAVGSSALQNPVYAQLKNALTAQSRDLGSKLLNDRMTNGTLY